MLIKFLGTAGARYVVAKQLRYSGGVYLECEGKKLILDPGPGTIVRMAKTKPPIDVTKIDGIILSHIHIDHSNDLNILIDGITEGGKRKRGNIFLPAQALDKKEGVLFNYLKNFPERIIAIKEKSEYNVGKCKFRTSASHIHQVETYGIKFYTNKGIASFIVDTKFFPGLIGEYKESKLLIINAVLLENKKGVLHLSIKDTVELIERIKPEKAILTHFGMRLLMASPHKIAEKIRQKTGVAVIAASDGMTVTI